MINCLGVFKANDVVLLVRKKIIGDHPPCSHVVSVTNNILHQHFAQYAYVWYNDYIYVNTGKTNRKKVNIELLLRNYI